MINGESLQLTKFNQNQTSDLSLMNINWNGTKPLVDPFSGEVIIRDLQSKELLKVYYKDGDQIKTLEGTIGSISRKKVLKFISQDTLTEYYKARR